MAGDARSLPLWARLSLGHGVVEVAARACSADVLHIKGPATASRLRCTERRSSDVDVLVRPRHATRLVDELRARGCELRTTFDSGSYFQHAATLFHETWSWIDVHRHFPGIGLDPADAFDLLWRDRSPLPLAGIEVQVPSAAHQALLLVLNSARDTDRGEADTRWLQEELDASEWDALEALSDRFDAKVAFAAATGHLDEFTSDPSHDLWQYMSRGGDRWDEWWARWHAARSARERVRVIHGLLAVNREWLAAELGHPPSRTDLRQVQRRRLRLGLAELRTRVTAR